MDIEVTTTLFEVTECGCYARSASSPLFGSLEQVMEDLYRWSQGRPLAQTKVFEVADGNDMDPVYLFSILPWQDGSGWLLVTWNETESFDGNVASVSGNAPVGSASVDVSPVRQGNIPGYPTYFYVVPSENIVVTVRHESRKAGRAGLQEYVKNFLRIGSRYAVHDDSNPDARRLLGYRQSEQDEPQNLTPKFSLREMRIPGRLDEIRQRSHEIRRVVRKVTLNVQQQVDRVLFQSLLAKIGLAHSNATSQLIDVKYDIHTAVSPRDLEAMIQEWEDNRSGTWDDFGVIFRGGGDNPTWFSYAIARAAFKLQVNVNGAADIDTSSLLAALHGKRHEILGLRG